MLSAVSQGIHEGNSYFPKQCCVFPVMLLGMAESR